MRCSYCHQRGHNKRTCPVLTQRMKAARRRRNRCGTYRRLLHSPVSGADRPQGQEEVTADSVATVGNIGHTRRTCDVMRKDREWLVIHHNAHVRVAHDYIVSSHIGLGSLFQMSQRLYNYDTGDYDRKNQLMVLTGFSINKAGKCDGFPIIATLRQLGSEGIEHSINIRHYVQDANHGGGWRSTPTLVTPMREVIPSDWVQKNAINFADTATFGVFPPHRQKEKRIGATGCSGTSPVPMRSSRSTPLSPMINTTTSVAPRMIWPATRPNTIVPSCSRISKVGSKIRALAFAPLHVAGWAIVAGAVVVRALTSGDKPRQEKGGEVPPPGYITEVTGSHDGRTIHDCPRHG